MIEQTAPSEQDLHAYIDGHLAPAEAARVAAYLACHPDAAALVESYRAQGAGLHALYDHVLDEPLPEQMLALMRRRRFAFLQRGFALTAALALVMVSTATGWWFNELHHGHFVAPAALVAEAQRAHLLFSGDDRWPADFGDQRDGGLAHLLSQRLGAPLVLPNAKRAGLSLRGVRLLPTPSGTAALLVYRDAAGRPAWLFVALVDAADVPPQAETSGDVTTLYRIANGLGYVVMLPRAGADAAVRIAFGMEPAS